MAGKPPAYELAKNVFYIFRSQSRFELKEFSVAGGISVVSATSFITVSEFLIPQTVVVFLNKQLRAGSGIVCTSSTRLGINNSKLGGKARIIVCQSLVLRLPDYVGKLSYF